MSTCNARRVDGRASAALFGKTQRAVLGLLFCHSVEAYHIHDIARRTGAGMGAVQRELARLVEAGLVVRSRKGNMVLHRANCRSPLFPALRELMVRTSGVADLLQGALTPLADRIRVAFVYGSIARGEETAESDVDVMVVGNVTLAEVVSAVRETQDSLGREVNPAVFPPEEFRKRLVAGRSFQRTVLREAKVFLIGGEDELADLALERVAAAAAGRS